MGKITFSAIGAHDAWRAQGARAALVALFAISARGPRL